MAASAPHRPAEAKDLYAARAVLAAAEGSMDHALDTEGLKEILYRHYEDPRWDEVAKRCLACANCTMVCPTCFCSTVEDVNDLDLNWGYSDRDQRWRSGLGAATCDQHPRAHRAVARTSIGVARGQEPLAGSPAA